MGAGLQQNIGKQWSSQVWKQVTESPPNQVFVEATERSAMNFAMDKKRKAEDEVKRKRRSSKYVKTDDNSVVARKAYSRHDEEGATPNESTEDVPAEHLELLKNGFYETKVVVTAEEANEIHTRPI